MSCSKTDLKEISMDDYVVEETYANQEILTKIMPLINYFNRDLHLTDKEDDSRKCLTKLRLES